MAKYNPSVKTVIFTLLMISAVLIVITSNDVFQWGGGFVLYAVGGLFLLSFIFSDIQSRVFESWPAIVLFLVSYFIIFYHDSELVKSKRIFAASTIGSGYGNWIVNLRKNGRYEIVSNNLLGHDSYKGKYAIEYNQIIFFDKHKEADYIPDTLTVFCHKMPLFYEDGIPQLVRDNYFKIFINEVIPIDEDCPEEFDYSWSPFE